MSTLDKVIEHFGSQVNMARALNTVPMSITHWKTRGVPLKRGLQIEALTDGKFSHKDLCDCSDIYGPIQEDAA